jgi:hypothetical protein
MAMSVVAVPSLAVTARCLHLRPPATGTHHAHGPSRLFHEETVLEARLAYQLAEQLLGASDALAARGACSLCRQEKLVDQHPKASLSVGYDSPCDGRQLADRVVLAREMPSEKIAQPAQLAMHGIDLGGLRRTPQRPGALDEVEMRRWMIHGGHGIVSLYF